MKRRSLLQTLLLCACAPAAPTCELGPICFFDSAHCQGDELVFECSGEVRPCEEEERCREGLFGASCQLPCGDGVVGSGEGCDPSAFIGVGGEGCDPQLCQVEVTPSCGDEVSDPGELCFAELPADAALNEPPELLLDIDADGDLDLITADGIFLNDGAGLFLPGGPTGLPVFLSQLSSADLDGDGLPELLGLSNEVIVAKSQGGVFAETQRVLMPAGAQLFAAGDVTGDGLPDVVVSGDNIGELFLLANDGAGGLSPFVTLLQAPTSLQVSRLALIDLDGDGVLELLVASPDGLERISVVQGGIIETPLTALAGLRIEVLLPADLDGDGDPDVAALAGSASSSARSLRILRNDSGQLTQLQSITEDVSLNLSAADFDGDGAIDLALLGEISALYRNESGVFGAPQYVSSRGFKHLAGDLTQDGKADLLFEGLNGLLSVLLGGAQ